MIRPDFIFSYWIFAWYLFYMAGLTQYSPIIAIWCGLFENFIILSLMIIYNTRLKLIFLFFLMMIPLKIIPLATLWKEERKREREKDVYALICLFLIYLVWSVVIWKNTFSLFKKNTLDMIFKNKNTLPGMNFINKIIY